MNKIDIVIIDPDVSVRAAGYSGLLAADAGFRIVATSEDGVDAIGLAGQCKPDLMLLATAAVQGECAAMVSVLRARIPELKIILITDDGSDEEVLASIAAGAKGFLTRSQVPDMIAKAVRCVHEGEAWVPRQMVARLIDRYAALAAVETPAEHHSSGDHG